MSEYYPCEKEIIAVKAFYAGLGEVLTDDNAISMLVGWSKGFGYLPALLVNGNKLFDVVKLAYYKANGSEVPESTNVEVPDVDEGGTTDIMNDEDEESEDAPDESDEVTE